MAITTSQEHYDALHSLLIQRPAYLAVRQKLLLHICPRADEKLYHLSLELQRLLRITYTWLPWAGFCALVLKNNGRHWRFACLMAIHIFYITAVTAVVSGYDRFRLPLESFYAVLFGTALSCTFGGLYFACSKVAKATRRT